MKSAIFRSILILLLAVSESRATTNAWAYLGTNGTLTYQTWGNGNQIMDFSWAGYMGGGVAIPTVATVQTLNPSGGDDTVALQNAINLVQSRSLVNGFRGALQLGPGTFYVSSQVNVSASGVVVRGSGTNSVGGTTIVMTNASGFTLFNLAGSGSPSKSGTVNITDSYVPSGTTTIDVNSTSGYSVGQTVLINRTVTTNWIDYMQMEIGGPYIKTNQNWISPGSVITTDRIITQISNNTITLDAPITDSFDTNYLGIPAGTMSKYSWSGRISQVGLENMTIVAPPVNVSYTAFNMGNIVDAWVRNVNIQDGVNCTIVQNSAKRVTLDSVNIIRTAVINAPDPPSDYMVTGTQILVNKCTSATSNGSVVWPFVTQAEGTGPIVALNFYSGEVRGMEPHQRWTTGLLCDNCTLPNTTSGEPGVAFFNRASDGSGHGWAMGWGVAWNGHAPYFEINAAPGTECWCIGGIGAQHSGPGPQGIFDKLGSIVTPNSLYLEQLKERLGGQAVENIGYQLFTISGTPASQNVAAGNNANFTVNVGDPTLMSNVVALSVTGVPANASVSLSTNSVTGAGTATLTVTTSNSLPPGTYTLNLVGTSAGLSHTSAVSIVVGSFGLSASPSSQSISPGSNITYTITATTNGNFTGEIDLGIGGLPANAAAGFSPPSLTGNGSSTLSITTANNTPVGSYTLTIFGTNASGTATTTATLNILATAANAGTLVWTNGSGADTNWSTVLNWTNISAGGNGAPGSSNSVLFTNYGAVASSALTSPGSGVVTPSLIDSFVNTSFLISALTNYANAPSSSPIYQNIGIAPGATLTISNGMQVGGFTAFDFGANNVTTLTISGSGATLQQGGSITVSQDSGSTGTHNAVLDMSGLDNLVMDGQQIRMGVEGGGNAKRASGILYLAKTNSLTLLSAGYSDSAGTGSPNSGNPALYFGHNGSTYGNGSQIYLGISNGIFADYATIGRGETNALFAFNPAFLGSNPSVYIRGTNGDPNRVGVYVVGDGSAGAQANNAPSTNDFSGGTVDAMINYLCVGRGRSTSSAVGGSGVLTFNTGAINANTLVAGFIYPAGSNSPATGVVNVNGSASLIVQSNIVLAQNANVSGQSAVSQGTLNINGGTVVAANVMGNGGLSTLALNAGALSLPSGNIANISAMNIGVPTGVVPAVLSGASSVSVSNALTIATNGVLAGNTAISSPELTVNGTIAPGLNGVGWITNNGPATFGPGGHFSVAVADAYGSPVEGWDFLGVTGALNIQATTTNPFTIDLSSFGEDVVSNFSFNTNYDWVIASAASISNFNAAAFTINISQFQNDLAGGYFYLHTNANSLVLSFTNNLPPTAGTAEFYLTGNVTLIPLSTLAPHWSDPDGDPVVFNGVLGTTNGAAVGADNTFIYYTNMNNVADDVTYTVADVRTNPPAVYQPGDTVLTAIGNIILLPPPSVSAAKTVGTNLVLSSSNGIPGNNVSVLGSTNLALPLSNWPVIQMGSFDTNGNLQVTNAIDPTVPQEFYLLQLQ